MGQQQQWHSFPCFRLSVRSFDIGAAETKRLRETENKLLKVIIVPHVRSSDLLAICHYILGVNLMRLFRWGGSVL